MHFCAATATELGTFLMDSAINNLSLPPPSLSLSNPLSRAVSSLVANVALQRCQSPLVTVREWLAGWHVLGAVEVCGVDRLIPILIPTGDQDNV